MSKKPTTLTQMRQGLGRSKSYTDGLVDTLAGSVTTLLGTKLDKISCVTATIPVTGWQTDSTAGYPKYYDISASGVTADDVAEIVIAPAGLSIAADCGMCSTNETRTNAVRVRAEGVPSAPIAIQYTIFKGGN